MREVPGNRGIRRLVVPLVAMALAGCGIDEGDDAGKLPVTLLGRDLAPGATGDDVRALQGYLTRFGYFPNPELAQRFPDWRPLVAERPQPGLYDGHTEAAVRALQGNMGIAATGLVGEDTRAQIQQGRCGVPDGMRPADRRNKFLIQNAAWDFTDLTWRFGTLTGCNLNANQMRPAVAAAFTSWTAVTNLTFTERTDGGAPTIWVQCADLGRGGNIAQAFGPADGPGQSIFLNHNGITWSVATGTPSNQEDLQSTMVHEIGHTLGLYHSSIGAGATVMHPFWEAGEQKRNLSTDDVVAIGILYNPFVTVAGAPCARDIAVGGTTGATSDIAWMIGCDNRLKKLQGGSWVFDTSAPGEVFALAVQPDGKPWIVIGGSGNVLRKNNASPTQGAWTNLGTCAQDIGIGATTNDLTGNNGPGTVWTLACGGDGRARRFNGSTFVQDTAANGVGIKIAVDSAGRPWLVNGQGQVFRKGSSSPTSGSWQIRPAAADGTFTIGTDIGVFHSGTTAWTWVLGLGATWVWNEQPSLGNGSCITNACRMAQWQWDDGLGTDISVGPCGPWVVQDTGSIIKRAECEARR